MYQPDQLSTRLSGCDQLIQPEIRSDVEPVQLSTENLLSINAKNMYCDQQLSNQQPYPQITQQIGQFAGNLNNINTSSYIGLPYQGWYNRNPYSRTSSQTSNDSPMSPHQFSQQQYVYMQQQQQLSASQTGYILPQMYLYQSTTPHQPMLKNSSHQTQPLNTTTAVPYTVRMQSSSPGLMSPSQPYCNDHYCNITEWPQRFSQPVPKFTTKKEPSRIHTSSESRREDEDEKNSQKRLKKIAL